MAKNMPAPRLRAQAEEGTASTAKRSGLLENKPLCRDPTRRVYHKAVTKEPLALNEHRFYTTNSD